MKSIQAEVGNRSRQERDWKELLLRPEILTSGLLVVMVVFMCIARPNTFPTVTNIFNVFRQFSLYVILASGMGMIIICGGVDLSLGTRIAFSACLGALLARDFNAPPIVVLLVMLAAGVALGAVNGVLVSKVGIPPFIATLGMSMAAKGGALVLTQAAPILYEPTWISVFGGEYIGPVPISVLVMLVSLSGAFIFLKYTQTGRNMYAVGNSPRAAQLSGIMTDRVIILAYAITGFCVGICALLLLGQMNSADPTFGNQYEMDVVAACVIGSISMKGGQGNIIGVLAGAAMMGVLRNMFVLLTISSHLQTVILGLLIIGAVSVDSIRKKRARK